ncbi:TetR/AcrR family transcriptional regulator [Streptomyces sp. NPDC051985]|uniref:TetR/AcrR family transcriptional regulator n=1 Tax=Streptomyces sp. NPDC051985 TaxID=3155807 RepID=UPI0034376FB9
MGGGQTAELSGRASRDERRPDVERRLLDAVGSLCDAGVSFAELSVSRLVREAGLGRATFYLYFPDRAAFVLRLAEHVRDRLTAPALDMWATILQDRTAFEAAVDDFAETFRSDYALVAALLETAATDPQVGKALNANMEMFIAKSAEVIEDGQRRRIVRADLHPFETAAALISMTERTCYRLAQEDDTEARRRLAQTLSALVWYALHEPVA